MKAGKSLEQIQAAGLPRTLRPLDEGLPVDPPLARAGLPEPREGREVTSARIRTEGAMIFGIHSLLFSETFVEKDLPVLDKCKRMGFDAVEIIPFDVDNFPAAKVRQAAGPGPHDQHRLRHAGRVQHHLPGSRGAPKGIELSKRLIDLSNEAGAKVFAGAIYCGWGYLSGRMRTADEWKWGVDSTRKVAEYAQRHVRAHHRHRAAQPLRVALHQRRRATRCGSSTTSACRTSRSTSTPST